MLGKRAHVGWALVVALGCSGGAEQAAQEREIVSKPITFTENRVAMTLDYIHLHYDSTAQDIVIDPQVIVAHWTAIPTFEATFAAFDPESLPAARAGISRGGRVNVSSQFSVDRDGTIYQLMPENWMARHTIGLNRIAIGIENVGSSDMPLTDEQLEANEWLARHLKAKYPGIKYLIGHHEYLEFRDTPLWAEKDSTYFTIKIDPGDEYMARLHERVSDLGLLARYGQ
jgi:N-acetyl-anhydromuramyl-L-alanine amidase AmpD